MDSTIRQRQRRGEATTLDLVRAGLVSPERIALADRVRAGGWTWPERRRLVREATELLGATLPARLAADYAARTHQSGEGAAAIAAARAWAAEPTEERRLTVAAAASAAASVAVNAAAYPAAWAAWAAADAAWAATYAGAAARAVDAAARAVDAAADAAADREAEHHWQRERLAIYLESPGWPPVEATPLKETP